MFKDRLLKTIIALGWLLVVIGGFGGITLLVYKSTGVMDFVSQGPAVLHLLGFSLTLVILLVIGLLMVVLEIYIVAFVKWLFVEPFSNKNKTDGGNV